MSALLDPTLLFRVFKPSEPPRVKGGERERRGGGGGKTDDISFYASTSVCKTSEEIRIVILCATYVLPGSNGVHTPICLLLTVLAAFKCASTVHGIMSRRRCVLPRSEPSVAPVCNGRLI
jgi:hypothetical protein